MFCSYIKDRKYEKMYLTSVTFDNDLTDLGNS